MIEISRATMYAVPYAPRPNVLIALIQPLDPGSIPNMAISHISKLISLA